MGKKWRRFLVQHILRSSKILCCFWIEAYNFFFFKWSYLQRCFDVSQCCENWRLKWQRCSIQRWNTQRRLNVVKRCKFQRWRMQRCFNVDLTLCCVAASYHLKITANWRWNVRWEITIMSLGNKLTVFQITVCETVVTKIYTF